MTWEIREVLRFSRCFARNRWLIKMSRFFFLSCHVVISDNNFHGKGLDMMGHRLSPWSPKVIICHVDFRWADSLLLVIGFWIVCNRWIYELSRFIRLFDLHNREFPFASRYFHRLLTFTLLILKLFVVLFLFFALLYN